VFAGESQDRGGSGLSRKVCEAASAVPIPAGLGFAGIVKFWCYQPKFVDDLLKLLNLEGVFKDIAADDAGNGDLDNEPDELPCGPYTCSGDDGPCPCPGSAQLKDNLKEHDLGDARGKVKTCGPHPDDWAVLNKMQCPDPDKACWLNFNPATGQRWYGGVGANTCALVCNCPENK
jgi:hypothetical protein